MPAQGKPSEFGGKVQDNTIQPADPGALSPKGNVYEGGHILTASEELRLPYLTGTTDQDAPLDPASMDGEVTATEWPL